MTLALNTFSNVNSPWQLSLLDSNFSQLASALGLLSPITLPYNVQNTNYVLQSTDRGGVVVFSGPGSVTYTIPAATYSPGDYILIKNITGGGGVITVAPNIFGFNLFLVGGPPVSQARTVSAIGLARLDFDSSSQATISGWGIT